MRRRGGSSLGSLCQAAADGTSACFQVCDPNNPSCAIGACNVPEVAFVTDPPLAAAQHDTRAASGNEVTYGGT